MTLKHHLTHAALLIHLLLFIIGGLSAFSFAPHHIWILHGLGLTLLMYLLLNAPSRKTAFLNAFWFGCGVGTCSMGWLTNALLIDAEAFVAFIPFVYIGMGLLFGLFYALPAFITSYAHTPVRKVICFTAAFVCFEWVRSWFLSGFPWNLTGSIWTSTLPILQFAGLFGIYGLSFITVLFFASLALLPRTKKLPMGMVLLMCLIYSAGLLKISATPADTVWGVKLRLVQPNIQQSLKWNPDTAEKNLSDLITLSKTNNDTITHVIWPETAVPFLIDKNESERLRLMSAVRQGGTLITGGLRMTESNPPVLSNSVFILDDLSNIVGFYDKSHLVPFGEYMPLADILPVRKLVPIPADFKAGDAIRTLTLPKAPPAGLLVCYEIIFSGQVVQKNVRPAWLINVTNDGWYGLSAGPYQHLDAAIMRAVEEGLPVIRAANTGISAVITPTGSIAAKLDLGHSGIVDAPLPVAAPATLYSKTGPWIVIFVCFILMTFSLKRPK